MAPSIRSNSNQNKHREAHGQETQSSSESTSSSSGGSTSNRGRFQQLIIRDVHDQQQNQQDDDIVEDIEEVAEEEDADLFALVPEDEEPTEDGVENGELIMLDEGDEEDENGDNDTLPDRQERQRQEYLIRYQQHASSRKHRHCNIRFLRKKLENDGNQINRNNDINDNNSDSTNEDKKERSSILLKIPKFLRSKIFSSIFPSFTSNQSYLDESGSNEHVNNATFNGDFINVADFSSATTSLDASTPGGAIGMNGVNDLVCSNDHLTPFIQSPISFPEIINHHFYYYNYYQQKVDKHDDTFLSSYFWTYDRSNLLSYHLKQETKLDSSSIFKHETGKFNVLPKNGICDLFPLPRSGHRMVDSEHYIYLFGGYNPHVSSSDRIPDNEIWSYSKPLFRELWRYSKLTRTWNYLSTTGPAPKELASHSALLLDDDHLLVYGGSGFPFGMVNSNKMYICDLKQLHWSQILYENDELQENINNNNQQPNYEIPIKAFGQALVYDEVNDLIYCCGGTTGLDYTLSLHEFNLKTKRWRLLSFTPENIEARYRHEMALYQNKLFVIGGGTSDRAFSLKQVPVFDLKENKWTLVDTKAWKCPTTGVESFPEPRFSHDCSQIDNLMYVVGGLEPSRAYNDCWCLNLDSMQWTKVGQLPTTCYFHSAVVNPNGHEMHVFGGVNCVKDKLRTNAMYKAYFKVPTLQKMAQEAVVKYLEDNLSLLTNQVYKKKNRKKKKVIASIKQIQEYLECMNINWKVLNLPEF